MCCNFEYFVYVLFVYLPCIHFVSSSETGIIRTIEEVLYPVEIVDEVLHALDRNVELRQIKLDMTECKFKQALISKRFPEVLKIIESGRLCGKAVTSYLRRAGFAEVALMFVEDNATRFDLALECGDMESACNAAQKIGTPAVWNRLAETALHQGDVSVVEHAYTKVDDKSKLSFLYTITGQFEKLKKLNKKIGEESSATSIMTQFQNSLILGQADQRVDILFKVGLLPLAYTCAKTHGMEENAEKMRGYLEEAGLAVPEVPPAKGTGNVSSLLFPPLATTSVESWPRKSSIKSFMDEVSKQMDSAPEQTPQTKESNFFGEETERKDAHDGFNIEEEAAPAPNQEAWGDDLDLGLEEVEEAPENQHVEDDFDTTMPETSYSVPEAGKSLKSSWVDGSVPSNHIASGSFKTAMELLNRQLGIVNFDPLRSVFFQIYESALAVSPSLPGMPGLRVTLAKTVHDHDTPVASTPYSLNTLKQRLQDMYKLFEGGKFKEADKLLDELFKMVPFISVEHEKETNHVKDTISILASYKTALLIELTRKSLSADSDEQKARQLELAAYLTHCNLQPKHVMLTLNLAMSLAYKLKNFIHASSFARRLLELPDAQHPSNKNIADKAKRVIASCNKQGGNSFKDLNYDEDKPFIVCPASLTPIYSGEPSVRSPFSGAAYKPGCKGQICKVDGMSKIGEETIGLVLL